jgi:hypothetical protein
MTIARALCMLSWLGPLQVIGWPKAITLSPDRGRGAHADGGQVTVGQRGGEVATRDERLGRGRADTAPAR